MRRVEGVVVQGHRVASGTSSESPYPAGTISMQMPTFASLGVDLSAYHPATINVDISPLRFSMRRSATRLDNVRWCEEHPPETFSFSRCRVVYNETEHDGMVYYPHPDTKRKHFQGDNLLEVLAPLIPGLKYGARIAVLVSDDVVFE